MTTPINKVPHWPDARGWIGTGIFALTIMLLWMMKDDELRGDEFFQTIATVIISNGLMAVVAWAYSTTKNSGEIAAKNADVVREVAATAPKKATEGVQEVEVVNTPERPAIVSDATTAAPDEGLPEHLR